jgi:hypothetical protein
VSFRPASIFASATVLFLWGCPVGNAPIASDGSASSTGSTAVSASSGGNTDAHTDPVDSKPDVSWVEQVQVPSKSAAVRMLLTDAPIDADNVFITFCGVRVAQGGGAGSPQTGDAEQNRADAGVAHDGANLDAEASAGSALSDAGGPVDHLAADAGASTSEPSNSGEGWISISSQCQTVDLLTLQNGITEDIGISTLPAGSYGQIRLMLTDASIVKGGVDQALVVPSGSESGVKIVGGFSVVEGQPTTVTIDFDAGNSIHFAPGRGFMLKPVIKIVDVTTHDGGAASGSGSAPGAARGEGDEATGGDGAGAAGDSGEAPESGGSDPAGSAGAAGRSGGHPATAPGRGRGEKGSAGAGGDSRD